MGGSTERAFSVPNQIQYVEIYRIWDKYTIESLRDTIDSRYFAAQYSTILHPAQQLRMQNFDETSNSRRTPIPHPNGRAMGFFREFFFSKLTAKYRERTVTCKGWFRYIKKSALSQAKLEVVRLSQALQIKRFEIQVALNISFSIQWTIIYVYCYIHTYIYDGLIPHIGS